MNLHTKNILQLNGNYQRLGFLSCQEAMIALTGENFDGTAPALALNFYYNYDEYGKPITDTYQSFEPLDWEDWIKLDGRKGDLDSFIHTSKRVIRIPTILVSHKYRLMPLRQERATPNSIRERDNNTCQYTGVKLTNKTWSLDHVTPKSKGGKDDWNNLVAAHKDVNSKKGNKFNHEVGLSLLNPIRPPRQQPLCNLVKGCFHVDQQWFP